MIDESNADCFAIVNL